MNWFQKAAQKTITGVLAVCMFVTALLFPIQMLLLLLVFLAPVLPFVFAIGFGAVVALAYMAHKRTKENEQCKING